MIKNKVLGFFIAGCIFLLSTLFGGDSYRRLSTPRGCASLFYIPESPVGASYW